MIKEAYRLQGRNGEEFREMGRSAILAMVALAMVLSVSACKKTGDEAAPDAGMETPSEPAPAPDAPET
jgi:predicted small lipoprotein YifL